RVFVLLLFTIHEQYKKLPVGTLRRWSTFWYNLPGHVTARMWAGGEENYAMKYNSEVLNRQYPVVALFVRHLAYARGLRAAMANLIDHTDPGRDVLQRARRSGATGAQGQVELPAATSLLLGRGASSALGSHVLR